MLPEAHFEGRSGLGGSEEGRSNQQRGCGEDSGTQVHGDFLCVDSLHSSRLTVRTYSTEPKHSLRTEGVESKQGGDSRRLQPQAGAAMFTSGSMAAPRMPASLTWATAMWVLPAS